MKEEERFLEYGRLRATGSFWLHLPINIVRSDPINTFLGRRFPPYFNKPLIDHLNMDRTILDCACPRSSRTRCAAYLYGMVSNVSAYRNGRYASISSVDTGCSTPSGRSKSSPNFATCSTIRESKDFVGMRVQDPDWSLYQLFYSASEKVSHEFGHRICVETRLYPVEVQYGNECIRVLPVTNASPCEEK